MREARETLIGLEIPWDERGNVFRLREQEVAAILAALSSAGIDCEGWRDIESAKKDGTIIWAVFHADIYPRLKPGRDDLERWNGAQVPLRHSGIPESGFDVGWSVALPVGHGGFPDDWIAGWRPLPPLASGGG